MVGLGRLELPTSRLSGVRSNQTELQARKEGTRQDITNGLISDAGSGFQEGMRRRRPAETLV